MKPGGSVNILISNRLLKKVAEKTLYGHEDVSGHGFIRAAKLLKINNTDLPKACAERTK